LARINDRASYEQPRRLATGVKAVLINGRLAFTVGQVQNRSAGVVVKRAS
jgi:hypothetical protein